MLIAMIVFTALMRRATSGEPMLFFNQYHEGVTALGKSKRSVPPNYPPLTAIEEKGLVWFQSAFYLSWMSLLLLLTANALNCVTLCRRKR